MANERIPTKASELSAQCKQAAIGISAEATWPADAPGIGEMNGHATAIDMKLALISSLEAQLRTAQADLRENIVPAARDDMMKVDDVTDMKYGGNSPQKLNFGLTPKKAGKGITPPPPPSSLKRPNITSIEPGVELKSLVVDFDPVDGAASYEGQWFTDSAMTGKPVGTAVETVSKFTAEDLNTGTQYWFRVRAVGSGALKSEWSDPDTGLGPL